MDPRLGWGLALLAVLAGWFGDGWRGLVLAFSVIVFWLLIQFSRSIRVMRAAAESPVGRVPSAVMLHSRLRTGLLMMQVVTMAKSLGRRLGDAPETWSWADDSGAEVRIVFEDGRCIGWTLHRTAEPGA